MRWRWVGAASVLLALLGCRGLPDDVQTSAEALPGRIDRTVESIDRARKSFEALVAEGERAYLREIVEREAVANGFDEARAAVERGRTLLATEVDPLLERDRPEDAAVMRREIERVRSLLDEAQRLAAAPEERARKLVRAKEDADAWVAEAVGFAPVVTERVAALEGEVGRASADYPAKAEDLAGRLAPVRALADEVRADVATLEREVARAPAERDLAAFVAAADRLAAHADTSAERDEALRQKIAELYRSYSKTLIDMRVGSRAVIERTSWNEAYDFPSESRYRYEREVDDAVAQKLESAARSPLATLRRNYVDSATWAALAIDKTRSLGSDNAAEFWLEELEPVYYHRYAIVENGKREERPFETVDEALFEKHVDDLGMDVVSKPYGVYEEEALAQAMPPGYAKVGNPKYGSWQTDASGRRYWSWAEGFLWYYLIFGNQRHYYYYDDWNAWNRGYRGQRPYYGTGSAPIYGTRGSVLRTSSRYRDTRAGRAGWLGGSRSLRGAGGRIRGGGPGSRGK